MQPWPLILAAWLACGCATAAHADTRPAGFLGEFQQSITPLPEARSLTIRGSHYVPAYSNVRRTSDNPGLSTLLRIDNTSATKPLVIERIDYFDTAGKLVQRYVENPIALKPFGAVQIFIPSEDSRGGPAANFVVGWAGNGPIAEPLIETVIFGTVGSASYSFVSPGRPIKTVGKKQWFGFGSLR